MTVRKDQEMARFEGQKLAFAKRLNAALDEAGVPQHTRASELRRRLQRHPRNTDAVPTRPAIKKWLDGDSLPEVKRIGIIADIVGKSVQWLMTGADLPLESVRVDDGLPILTLAQAAAICQSGEMPLADMADEQIISPVRVGPRAFGLIVRGDAMTSATGGRSYPDGTIVIIDPDHVPETGQRVFARINGSDYTVRELMDDAGLWMLRPLNPHYRTIEVADRADVLGVVRCGVVKE